ncbi:Metal tolerance protein C4 [Zea mays]|uniref:Metal tolerance protein C4 n=1 Tax=Zea mays TaxID=4577 RepID=A0A3L6G471_MAIZE|nr:Metal tolerance protein C4 [Zea mays]
MSKDDTELLRVMANYGEDVVEALGYEVDRLESEIQKLVPGIKHVDIEAHNPEGLALRAEFDLGPPPFDKIVFHWQYEWSNLRLKKSKELYFEIEWSKILNRDKIDDKIEGSFIGVEGIALGLKGMEGD